MTSLAEIRQQYPQYANVSDGDLLLGLNRKFYPDMHPREFLNQIDGGANAHATVKNPELRTWYRDRVSQPMAGEAPEQTQIRLGGQITPQVSEGGRLGAGARSAFQGMTFGYGDEIVGHGASILGGGTPDQEIAKERQRLAMGEEKYPGQSIAAEIGGAVMAPGATIKSAPGAIAAGTGGGMLYASGKAEGGAEERTTAAIRELPTSLFFSAAAVPVQKMASKGLHRIVKGAEKRPSLGALRTVKNTAYDAVDKSGFSFSEDDILNMAARIETDMNAPNSSYVKGDAATERAFRLIEKNLGGAKTLTDVDKLRSRLMKRWAVAGKDEAGAIMDMVSQIDDLIDSAAGASELMKTAREAHKTYMRVDFLEKAFQKAADSTAVSGSGGNIYNNYGRVFKNILNNPKQARMFTPEQQQFMRAAMESKASDGALRKLGKLSPDGNGLMLALNVIGGSIDPTLFAVGGAGAVAKGISDHGMKTQIDDILGIASGMTPRAPTTTPTQLPTAAAIAGQNLQDR